MKKLLQTVLATAVLGTSGFAFAETHNGNGDGCRVSNGNDNGCCEMECCCHEDKGYRVWADLLVMHPCQNLRFARDATPPINNNITDFFGEWDWEPGFRVGAGFKVPCHQWSINGEFTYISPDWTASASGQDLVGTLAGLFQPADRPDTVTAVYELDYYTLDIVAAYSCCMCEALELTPYGGFRALWMDTDVTERGLSGNSWNANNSVTWADEYRGFGLTGGLRWKFYTCYPVHLFGHVGASGLAGSHDISATSRYDTAPIVQSLRSDEDCHPNFGVEGSIGLLWQGCLCGLPINVSTRYEHISWSDAVDPWGNGEETFALHGFSFRFGLDF